jgi:thioredoxin-related protein
MKIHYEALLHYPGSVQNPISPFHSYSPTCSMKYFILTLCLTLAIASFSSAQTQSGGLTWYTDLEKAIEVSNSTKKPVFGFFTGSDWCGWCHKLQRDVFAKNAFIEWAKKNVVLLELDFPRNKQLPAELAQQNQNLAKQFQVQGFPTVWYFNGSKDKSGKRNLTPLGSHGYPSGAEKGKEELRFLADAEAILKRKQ